MEGREKCFEEDLDAKEKELPDDDRSLSRKSSQSSFIESRKSSVTKMRRGRRLERGSSETSCDLATVRRELESWSQRESQEPPTEDGTEEHVLVSCTASSYFTPTEGLDVDRDKQSEEKR